MLLILIRSCGVCISHQSDRRIGVCTSHQSDQEGPTGYYHMTSTAPRVISSQNVKKIRFRAVRVEVIGPEKRVVKLETRTPRKIDAI